MYSCVNIRITIILLFLGCAFSANAESLLVWLNNGEIVRHDLTESPKTFFENGDLVIGTKTASFHYPLRSVLRYTYELSSALITEVKDSPTVRFRYDNDNIYIESSRLNVPVKLYSADGMLLNETIISEVGSVVIPMSSYSTGVYIVKVDQFTHKFLK